MSTSVQVQSAAEEEIILITSPRPHIRQLTLNRPAKRNALSQDVIVKLIDALSRASADDDVHVVVITGSGSLFSAGADLKDIAKLDADGARRVRYLENLCHAMDSMRKPLIAAVERMALGGGFELALMCDLIVSSGEALFGFPEVNVGLLPGAGGTQRLTSVVGKYRAMKMILSGKPIPATQAEQYGLISTVCSAGQALEEALELGSDLASKSVSAAMLAKEAVQRAENLSLDLEFERSLYYGAFGTADKREGVHAFLEKRPPVWNAGGHERGGATEGSGLPVRSSQP